MKNHSMSKDVHNGRGGLSSIYPSIYMRLDRKIKRHSPALESLTTDICDIEIRDTEFLLTIK